VVFIREQDQAAVRERLQAMADPVRLVFFTQQLECQFCRETGQLLEELVALSPKLVLETYNFQIDKEKVAQYGVDKIPATVVEGKKDYGIRFYGIAAGYEFASLLDAILLVSRGDSGLPPETRQVLASVTRPARIEVFATPT